MCPLIRKFIRSLDRGTETGFCFSRRINNFYNHSLISGEVGTITKPDAVIGMGLDLWPERFGVIGKFFERFGSINENIRCCCPNFH